MMLNRRASSSRGPSCRRLVLGSALLLSAAGVASAQPANDFCEDAGGFVLSVGVPYTGSAVDASADPNSDSTCAAYGQTPDVYHQFTPPFSGLFTFSMCDSSGLWDSVVSIHTGCPANDTNQVNGSAGCGDNGCGSTHGFTHFSVVLQGGVTYTVRVAMHEDEIISAPPAAYTMLITAASDAPRGGCCTGETCTILTEAECDDQSGAYLGDNMLCNPPSGAPTAYNGTGGSIPDGSLAGRVSPVNVAESFAVGTVEVRLNGIVHPWIGDLQVRLSHGGTEFVLFSRIDLANSDFGDSSNLNGIYTFGDSGTVNIADAAASAGDVNIPAGTYLCADANELDASLSIPFHNADANGMWTLTVVDAASSFAGSFTSWDLILTHAGETACGEPACPADFNNVNGVTVQDIFDFLTAWLAGNPSADFNHVNGVTVQDIFDFLTAWLAGC